MADKNMQLMYVKPFDGNSFSNWEFRVKLLLEQQGVLNVLTEEPPTKNAEKVAKYTKREVKTRTIIVQCLSDNVLETVKTKKTARGIMECLTST